MCQTQNETSKLDNRSPNSKRILGFDAKNKDSLTVYLCHICNLILRYPCQLNCGHRFCRSCLDDEEGSSIKCVKCGEETLKESVVLDKGCRHDMERLDISCCFCEWNGIFKLYEEHLNSSHQNPTCQHCAQQFDSANSLTQHVFVCEKMLIDCTLKSHGCGQQFLRMNARDHFLSEEHQSLLLRVLTEKRSSSAEYPDEQQSISSYTTTFPTTMTDKSSDISAQELYKMMEQLLGGVGALSDDAQRLSSESLLHQNIIESSSDELLRMKLAVQESNSLLNAHKSNQQILEQNFASLQQELHDMKNTSYDGTFIWKITNFQQKLADAQSEKQTSLYSPAFYSSANGYKMRVRLYPAGDGNARRTHMSLFFVLMRGEYDAVLQFPFNFKVNFCLFDQTPQQRHLIDSFQPDVKSNSFQRPRSDMNIASGIPKFCPLTIIQHENNPYVVDDTILIKIMVDFSHIPKAALPYTLSLNPGLPTLLRHELIKLEIEKHAQKSTSTKPEAK